MAKQIIGGVFTHVENAEKAIKELKAVDFNSEEISVFAKDKDKVKDVEEETDTDVSQNKAGRGKNSGKGAGIGATSGGTLGGIVGLIAGVGLLAIPGIGQVAAAGPLVSTLSGAGIGAGGGGIVGALVGAGIPEEQAKQYEEYLKDGKILVFVEAAEDKQETVYRIFLSSQTENTTMYPQEVLR